MTHACCTDCRVRAFAASPAAAPPCPDCGRPMTIAAATQSVGFRLVTPQQMPDAAAAVAVALPVRPDHRS